jgi:hypothetical protein
MFYELSYWIQFVAKCSNILVDPSFMNSVTGSGFVAKCSNIDSSINNFQLYQFVLIVNSCNVHVF